MPGCIDSRAAPELVFDQSIGDLFVARVAGNTVNEEPHPQGAGGRGKIRIVGAIYDTASGKVTWL